jgi:hypothetical protein
MLAPLDDNSPRPHQTIVDATDSPPSYDVSTKACNGTFRDAVVGHQSLPE